MGLDMYAFAVPQPVVGDTQVDLTLPDGVRGMPICAWRKFNHLHGWMERLYRLKGGTRDFNGDTVRLNLEDLTNLEELIQKMVKGEPGLEHTPGFFFGGPTVYPEDLDTTLTFIADARQAIFRGNAVFYDSWW